MGDPLGSRHPRVRALRELARSRRARDAAGRFVLEGHRIVSAALERGVVPVEFFRGPHLDGAAEAVVVALRDRGVPEHCLAPGAAERVGSTVTPPALFAVADLVRRGPDDLRAALAPAAGDLLAVVAEVADPGNAGTLARSAEAAGARLFVLGAGSVDAYNPKVVRASAGALFGLTVVEGAETMAVLEELATAGVACLGTRPAGGRPPEAFDFSGPTALVLGHETRGLPAGLPLDGVVTLPMAGSAESLNVAMAGTALLFEVARQRRASGGVR